MITVTRWMDSDPEIVLRSPDVSRPGDEAVAWSNGDNVHLAVGSFEVAMPSELWASALAAVVGAIDGDAKVAAPSVIGPDPEKSNDGFPGLAERLALVLRMGGGAGTVVSDDELLGEVARIQRLHDNRLSLNRWRHNSHPTPSERAAAAMSELVAGGE